MKLITDRTIIKILSIKYAKLLLDYYINNKEHLDPWEPVRDDDFYTLEHFIKIIQQNQNYYNNKTALKFVALNKERSEIIGVCNFTNILYGVFQARNLGYSIAEKYQGKGLMLEILERAILYVFEELKLHRIMANYIPSNIRSEKLLMKLGFEKEGYARSYLKISGKWQDHILTAKLNPKQHNT